MIRILLALACLAMCAAMPDRELPLPPPIDPLPAVPLVCNYHNARVTIDGEAITIESAQWFGHGKMEESTGVYHIIWLSKPSGEVKYLGRYWFDDEGHCVGRWLMIGGGDEACWGSDRYARLPDFVE